MCSVDRCVVVYWYGRVYLTLPLVSFLILNAIFTFSPFSFSPIIWPNSLIIDVILFFASLFFVLSISHFLVIIPSNELVVQLFYLPFFILFLFSISISICTSVHLMFWILSKRTMEATTRCVYYTDGIYTQAYSFESPYTQYSIRDRMCSFFFSSSQTFVLYNNTVIENIKHTKWLHFHLIGNFFWFSFAFFRYPNTLDFFGAYAIIWLVWCESAIGLFWFRVARLWQIKLFFAAS